MSRCTECCQRIAGWYRQAYSFFAHQPKSECCRKMFFFLAYVVATAGSVAYCFYLIWLLAYVKDSGYYWFFAFIPALFILLSLVMVIFFYEYKLWDLAAFSVLFGVMLMLMCSFTMLTRQAYYHLSTDVFIGPQWVIMSLKASIVFFVCGFLAIQGECRLQKILEDKDLLTRGLLDFVDIFNLVELLSFNKCVGIGSSVTEGSSLEMAIQAFCTMSLLIMINVYDVADLLIYDNPYLPTVHNIYPLSVLFQNIPFLIIRIIVWSRYNVFSLGFMVKNVLAIVVCCAEIYPKKDDYSLRADNEKPNNDEEPDSVNGDQPV